MMTYNKFYKEIIGKCNLFTVGNIGSTRCEHSMNYKHYCSYDVCPLVIYGN
jgi:hypothetical protein